MVGCGRRHVPYRRVIASRNAIGRSVCRRSICFARSWTYCTPCVCPSTPTASMQWSGPRPAVMSLRTSWTLSTSS